MTLFYIQRGIRIVKQNLIDTALRPLYTSNMFLRPKFVPISSGLCYILIVISKVCIFRIKITEFLCGIASLRAISSQKA